MKKRISGFTLIELLVVIAIIGILSALGLVSLHGAREKARNAQARTDLDAVRTALRIYADDHSGSYPGERNNGTPEDSGCATNPIDPSAGIWADGGPLIPDYLGREILAPHCWQNGPIVGGGYFYISNNSVDSGSAENCETTNCYVLFYSLETRPDRRWYALFEDGEVDETVTSSQLLECDNGADCRFAL